MSDSNKKREKNPRLELPPYILGLRAFAQACVERDQVERSKKPTPKKSRLLGTFKSSSSDTIYRVMIGNMITCTCPGYTFRRNCKHVKEFV